MNRTKAIIALIFPAVILFGYLNIADIRVFGLVLTIGRVFIPVICLYLIIYEKQKGYSIIPAPRTKERMLLIVIAIWVIYAGITLFVMPYVDLHTGVNEIIALLLGSLTIISVVILCRNGEWNKVLIGIRIVVAITLVIGICELTTGNHLSTSRYCDPEFLKLSKALLGDEADSVRWYIATSIFYNENDYSAMLAVFAPLLVCGKPCKNKIEKGTGIVLLCFCLAILYFNNAFICAIAFAVGILIVLAMGIKDNRERLTIILSLTITRITILLLEKKLMLALGLGDTLAIQVEKMDEGIGSLTYRLNTYKITIIETFVTGKGIGFGPGSFSNYFSRFTESESMMSNPHCFWLEILAEYGMLILLMFATALVLIMASLIAKYLQTKEAQFAAIIASGVSLIIASVAPSAYLKYAYYWIPIALAVYLADYYEIQKKAGED